MYASELSSLLLQFLISLMRRLHTLQMVAPAYANRNYGYV